MTEGSEGFDPARGYELGDLEDVDRGEAGVFGVAGLIQANAELVVPRSMPMFMGGG